MKTASELKIQKVGDYQYLVIYFKYRGNMIRINTKYRYLGKEFHAKSGLAYNNKVAYHLRINAAIATMKYKVDMYIGEQMRQLYPRVSHKECLAYINGGYKEPKDIKLLVYFQKFYKEKEVELQNPMSLKDYKSLENALTDFQLYKKALFRPKDITPQLLLEFRNFLSDEHPAKKEYKTKGNLNNNTIHKRISSFRTFCRWLEEQEIAVFKEKLYTIETVKKYDPDTVILSKEEMQVLIELKPENKFEEKIIDLFILNCYMGMRWSDFSTIEKGIFQNDAEGNTSYIKVNEKTEETIVIPILPTAKRILEKYQYKLPKYTQQYFNRELKNILENHNLFETEIPKKKRQLGKIEPTNFKKRELISSHTCRRTFITLAVSANVPLNAIMLATGHTQLKTLQKYAKKQQNYDSFKGIE
jgi:integrase